jgi:hypothetical protein
MRTSTRYDIRRLVGVAGALAMMITAAVVAVGATPASANTIPVGSVIAVSQPSGFSTVSPKTTAAVCPADRPRVLGGGFTTTGTHIVVSQAQPLAGSPTDSYQVTAGFDQVGTAASWQLLVYAYCSSAAPGWQIVPATSTSTSDAFNEVAAACPSGKEVVGTGGRITGGAGQVELVTQTGFPRQAVAGGLEDLDGFAGSWSATAYAVCVTVANVLDIHAVQNQTASDTTNPKSVSVTCPSGTQLTGSAVWADQPGNAISLRPNSSTPTSVTAIARDDSGSGGAFDVLVYGLCAQ